MNIRNERERLIDAALSHAAFEGMNMAAIRAAANDLGMDAGLALVLLPGGGADLAAANHRRGDLAVRDWLQTDPPKGGFRDRVAQAVLHRLENTDRELARAGAAILALPQNVGLGAKLLWETADVIWDGLGDTSQDVNWYSKRATLSAVYGATVLFWLGDDSDNIHDTRRFLDRRLDGVMRFEKLKSFARKLPGVSAAASAATGWIRKPGDNHLPGRWWHRGAAQTETENRNDG